MSDVRRVMMFDCSDMTANYDCIMDDPNGTDALLPWEDYERWQRSRVKYAPGEENELLREQITEMQAEIERLQKVIESRTRWAIERLREQLRLANLDAAINEARANDLEQSRQVPLPRGKFKDEEMEYSERLVEPEDSDE